MPFQPERPKHCPHGHKFISWTWGDDHVYCWDCDREYGVGECFDRAGSVEGDCGDGDDGSEDVDQTPA